MTGRLRSRAGADTGFQRGGALEEFGVGWGGGAGGGNLTVTGRVLHFYVRKNQSKSILI